MEPPDTDALIETLFVERIHNSPVSRHPESYACVRGFVDALKAALRGDPAAPAAITTETPADDASGGEG